MEYQIQLRWSYYLNITDQIEIHLYCESTQHRNFEGKSKAFYIKYEYFRAYVGSIISTVLKKNKVYGWKK